MGNITLDGEKRAVRDYYIKGIKQIKQESIDRYIRDIRKKDPEWLRDIQNTGIGSLQQQDEGVKNETRTDTTIEHTLILKDRFTNEEQLAKFCNIDLKLWRADKITANEWNTSSIFVCWQFKVTWRRINDLTVDHILDAIREVNVQSPLILPKYTDKRLGSVAVEVSIPDLHLGRLAWEHETGANYDVKIAYREWIKAHRYFARLSDSYDIDTVLLPLGNDYFNVDNAAKTTTNGTSQDEDGRWQRSFQYGYKAAVDAIELYRSLGLKVIVKIIPGNHDWERNYYLGFALSVAYHDCKEVKIDNSPAPRKYFVYGRNMVGFSHGDKDKAEIKHVYQSEMRKYMSQCDNIEMHLAHLHQERVTEQNGSVIMRVIPSLAQRSAWETGKGYSGNRRSQAFVWHRTKGLLDINYYTPDYETRG